MNGIVYLCTDGIKMVVHIVICKTENQQSILFKNRTSFCIVSLALLGIVLKTVQLDHKPCLCTVKVNDKGFNDPLLVDFYRIITQKQIPKLSLLRSRWCGAEHVQYQAFYNFC